MHGHLNVNLSQCTVTWTSIYHNAWSPERQFITMHGHLNVNLSQCTVTWTSNNFNDYTETWNNLLAITNKRNFTLTLHRKITDLPHKGSHVFWWKGLEEGRTCWHWPNLQQIHHVQRTLCLGISREVMSPVLFSCSYASSITVTYHSRNEDIILYNSPNQWQHEHNLHFTCFKKRKYVHKTRTTT